LYGRDGVYGESGVDYPDNHIRFAVFCRGAIAVARSLFKTEIFHCHDWQAGLVPAYLRTTFASDPTFLGVKTLFTIHNLGYQGLFPKTVLPELGLDPALFRPDGLEFFGSVSYIKGGIALADALNTVSPTYAREIQTPEYGFGLDGALRARADALTGILNGVDYRSLLGGRPRRQARLQGTAAGGIRPAARGPGAPAHRHGVPVYAPERRGPPGGGRRPVRCRRRLSGGAWERRPRGRRD